MKSGPDLASSKDSLKIGFGPSVFVVQGLFEFDVSFVFVFERGWGWYLLCLRQTSSARHRKRETD